MAVQSAFKLQDLQMLGFDKSASQVHSAVLREGDGQHRGFSNSQRYDIDGLVTNDLEESRYQSHVFLSRVDEIDASLSCLRADQWPHICAFMCARCDLEFAGFLYQAVLPGIDAADENGGRERHTPLARSSESGADKRGGGGLFIRVRKHDAVIFGALVRLKNTNFPQQFASI